MSGRSAYVRKKNNQVKDRVPTRRAPSQQGSYPISYGDQPSTSHNSTYQSAAFHRQRSGTSISSGSEVDQHGRRQNLPAAESGIEKSALRSFMDSKSDKVRNKLASTISGSAPRTDETSPVRPGSAASPDRSFEPSGVTSPIPVPNSQRPRIQQQESSFEMGHHRNNRGGSADLGPIVKRWVGGGRLPQPWNKLRKDPELWDPLGDTLVYFGHETHQGTRPAPSFRIPSSVLEETESAFLITILREGYTYNNDFDFPPSPNSPSSTGPGSGHNQSRGSPSRYGVSQSSTIENGMPMRSPKALPSMHSYANKIQPTPPSSSDPINDKGAAPVLHEIYFPAPVNQSKTDNLRHHLTTRNVFALLMHKSLVGINLFQALADLHERLEMYMPPESDNTSMIIDYIVSRGLDDVRNDPASASGLLAWSEGTNVRWREGWREAFVNCAGMYNRLGGVPESRDISPISRALLERANLELQVRIQQAEEKLAAFDLGELWPVSGTNPPPAYGSFERFRKFLVKFYEHVYWTWPPRYEADRELWLTRDLVMRLQRDFGALYDYLVDRDVEWDESEERSGRKWNIISKTKKADFVADHKDLPITDILISFDNQRRYQHIPHPFPILPESIPPPPPPAKQSSLFGSKKTKPVDDRATEKRAALAYSEATNIYHLGSEFVSNELVEAFSRFEKTDRPGEVDPFQARKGRWILLYGILQILSTLSVDTPGLRFVDDVDYFLSPRLRGTPPWRNQHEPSIEEATPQASHCWTAPRTWVSRDDRMPDRTISTKQQQQVIITGLTADGRARVSSDTDSPDESSSRARQWVNNGGDFRDDNDTVPRWNPKEKIRDWPIPPSGRSRYTRDVGISDYQPPAEW